jgi:hypothetical protein
MKNPVPEWLPVSCASCKHLKEEASVFCAAYPQGIPVWIRGNNDSHLTPQPGDHGIQYEPSDEFVKTLTDEGILPQQDPSAEAALDSEQIEQEIERYTRIGRSDVRRALALIKEASPELADMVKAKDGPEVNMDERDVSDVANESKIKTIKFRATYTGILKVEGDDRQCLSYCVYARNQHGQVRLINGSVYVTEPSDLARLQNEFEVGDRIEITDETDWSLPDLPVRLISFEKVAAAAEDEGRCD